MCTCIAIKIILSALLILSYLFFSLSENDCFLCIVTFVLVYYFSMVGAVWFVILAFSWSICFKSLGSTRDNFSGKVIYFHIIAWTYPLTLAISVLALKQVIWQSLNPWTYLEVKVNKINYTCNLTCLSLISNSFLVHCN